MNVIDLMYALSQCSGHLQDNLFVHATFRLERFVNSLKLTHTD